MSLEDQRRSITDTTHHFKNKKEETSVRLDCGRNPQNGDRDVTVAFDPVKIAESGAAPTGLPISKSARSRSRRSGGLQNHSYPVQRVAQSAILRRPRSAICVAAGAATLGARSNFIGHEEDSNPRRLGRRTRNASAFFLIRGAPSAQPPERQILGAAPRCPTIFNHAPVAQLYRAPRYERGGCRLESCRERHYRKRRDALECVGRV